MAKTKPDYIKDGESAYKNGNPRPLGDSWQAKAEQEGYDIAKELHDDIKADRAKYQTAKLLPIGSDKHNAVVSHIRILVTDAVNGAANPERSQRLMNKVNKLAAKHSINVANVL